MSAYREYVTSNERWFRGRFPESDDALRCAELQLNVAFPDDLKWVLNTYGYWHATGVCSLDDTIERTQAARIHVQLPHQWIVLYDHHDGGVILLDTAPHPASGEHTVV